MGAAERPVAAQSRDAVDSSAATPDRALGISGGELQRFPGAVVEAITADPGSAHGKLSGAPMANTLGSHNKNVRSCKQTAKMDK